MNPAAFLPDNINWMFILVQCPFFATLGTIAHICKLSYNLTHMDDVTKTPMTDNFQSLDFRKVIMEPLELIWNRCGWTISRLFIGYITGVLVGLYFLSEMQNTDRLMLKVFGLCILIGALAPHLWSNHEKLIEHYVVKTTQSHLLSLPPNGAKKSESTYIQSTTPGQSTTETET